MPKKCRGTRRKQFVYVIQCYECHILWGECNVINLRSWTYLGSSNSSPSFPCHNPQSLRGTVTSIASKAPVGYYCSKHTRASVLLPLTTRHNSYNSLNGPGIDLALVLFWHRHGIPKLTQRVYRNTINEQETNQHINKHKGTSYLSAFLNLGMITILV